jgi:hypothetical protein
VEARLRPKVKPRLVASSSNSERRHSGGIIGGGVKLVLTRERGYMDRPCRSVPANCTLFLSFLPNEPTTPHKHAYTWSRYEPEVDSKSTTPLYYCTCRSDGMVVVRAKPVGNSMHFSGLYASTLTLLTLTSEMLSIEYLAFSYLNSTNNGCS